MAGKWMKWKMRITVLRNRTAFLHEIDDSTEMKCSHISRQKTGGKSKFIYKQLIFCLLALNTYL